MRTPHFVGSVFSASRNSSAVLDKLQVQLFEGGEQQIRPWTRGGYYVSGAELVAAGLAEMLTL